MDTGIANIIASSIIAVGGIVASVIFSYVPRTRREKVEKLRKELFEAYQGMLELKEIEESLEKQSGISKQAARKGHDLPEKFQTARLKQRISQLEQLLS